MHAELPLPALQLLEADGVIIVLCIIRVDRADALAADVHAPRQRRRCVESVHGSARLGSFDGGGQRVPIRQDHPLSMLLGQRADEALLRSRDNLHNAAAPQRLAVTLAALGDFGAHDVAGHGAAVFALGDEQILPVRRIGRHHKPKAPQVMPVNAHEFVAARRPLRGRQQQMAPRAQDHVPLMHQVAQRIAKCVVLFVVVQIQVAGQSARPLGPIVGRFEMFKYSRLDWIRHLSWF